MATALVAMEPFTLGRSGDPKIQSVDHGEGHMANALFVSLTDPVAELFLSSTGKFNSNDGSRYEEHSMAELLEQIMDLGGVRVKLSDLKVRGRDHAIA